jgi:hypothetical protein
MLQVEIRFKGQITAQWSEWFGGLTVSHSDDDETFLSGPVADQSALYGILARLRDLGLQLTSVSSEEIASSGLDTPEDHGLLDLPRNDERKGVYDDKQK